jgi:enamine deaminase RidA (YjgF/YER057c/UK114 family)
MRKLLLIPALLIAGAAYAQTKNAVQLVNPSSVAAPKGYSQAAVIDLGHSTMVILSGQVPLDKEGKLVGKDDIGQQARQVFQNIKSIVEEMGGTMKDVIKLNFLLTDLTNIQSVRAARDQFINTQHPPASTLAQVTKLFRDDVFIEIEATAVIPKKTQ